MSIVSRRSFLAGSSLATMAALASTRLAFAQDQRLRYSWWGNADRSERTTQVIDLFLTENPGVQIDGQSLPGGGDYWTWLATQTAGGNPPDLIQMDYRYIFEYAGRGVLLALDEYVGTQIDLSSWPADRLNAGRIEGKNYGISLGASSWSAVYNQTAWEEVGISAPSIGTTWEEFAANCEELTAKTGRDNFYGSQDASGHEGAFTVFVRQRGKSLYDAEGRLGFDEEDAIAWFGMWDAMRRARACVPADVQALSQGNVDTSVVTVGRAATGVFSSNQLVSYQNLNTDALGITAIPVVEGGTPGQYLGPSQFLSVSARTANPELAAQFINFFLNNEEAANILAVERGAPESPAIRELIAPSLDEASQRVLTYLNEMAPVTGPLPPPPPQGAGEGTTVLVTTAEEVAFEMKSVEQGAKDLVAGMTEAIAR